MKRLLYIVIFLLTCACVMPVTSFADILPDGKKGVEYCFQIDNINTYPDYTFIAYPTSWDDSYLTLHKDTCLRFYKNVTPTIYAIPTKHFSEKDILTDSKNYFSNNTYLLSSAFTIHDYSLVDIHSPLEKVIDIATITSLTETNFEIKKARIIYTYSDNTREEKKYSDKNIAPEPSRKVSVQAWLADIWYLLLPIITSIIIGVILVSRRHKKKK